MNILIVDDEVFTVRAIQTTLNWESLGIQKVFTAYNAAKAREIIAEQKIDLMLCDIEMPREDGLSLVSWLRGQGYTMEIIFLTCHSEFEYARRALKLKVFDYAVKPVDFDEMEKVIKNAVDKLETERQKEIKTRMGEYWMENKQVVEQRFWQSLLTPAEPKTPEEMAQDARKQNIDFDKDKVYRLILISVKKIRTLLDQWNDELLIFTLQNLAKELILQDLYSNRTLEDRDKFLIISETQNVDEMRQLCESYVAVCKKYVGTSVFCYVSNGIFCEEFAQSYESLCLVEKNDVAGSEEIVFDHGSRRAGDSADLSVPEQMRELLYRGDTKSFWKMYSAFISDAAAGHRLDYNSLKNVQQDLLQCFFVYMERNHIYAHQVHWLSQENAESVEQLNGWVKRCLDTLLWKQSDRPATAAAQVVETIKDYILGHLGEDLTRESIAGQVNLSPDYMSKIFKSEVGITLSQYIIDERMEKAVLLMHTTRLNVSQIAREVGCDNFSYFTKLFKKHTGQTPREYRLKS